MTDTTHPAHVGQSAHAVARRLLDQRFEVDEDFYQALLTRAHDNIPRLQYDVVYKAQDVLGREYWDSLADHWIRRLAGQVLSHLVANKKLPLRFASCRYCTTKRYMRR